MIFPIDSYQLMRNRDTVNNKPVWNRNFFKKHINYRFLSLAIQTSNIDPSRGFSQIKSFVSHWVLPVFFESTRMKMERDLYHHLSISYL